MNKIIFITSLFTFLLFSQDSYCQIARQLDHKEVSELKSSNTYFVLLEEGNSLNISIKEIVKNNWDFNDLIFIFPNEISSIKDKKKAYIIGFGNSSITMGYSAGLNGELSSPGSTSSFSALFISKKIDESILNHSHKWSGGYFTKNPFDLLQFLPLCVKSVNSMLHTIEINKSSKFNASTAQKVYNKQKSSLKDKTIYLLDEQIPRDKKGKNYRKKVKEILSSNKGKIKVVDRETLASAIENEEDVIFINFYNELKFNMYSAISCKTGQVLAMDSNKFFYYWKFVELSLKKIYN
jgi:uncharacterized protein YdcH (DUF465 family)